MQLASIQNAISEIVIGHSESVEKLMIALIAEGHVLIEDLPGLGKTTLSKTFASLLDCQFARVQFTPDLTPLDLLGMTVYHQSLGSFEFQKGPVFTNILLADEINRTSPKTQSGLLEAMEEGQVTNDGQTYILNKPFMVIATQNPVAFAGTFPLPEAQLDRFMMRMHLGYPTEAEETKILETKGEAVILKPLYGVPEIIKAIDMAKKVYVDEAVRHYIVALCRATRSHDAIHIGASPRASVHLYEASKASAFLSGRDFVTERDVKKLFKSVVSHRLILKHEAAYAGKSLEKILDGILTVTSVPTVKRD